MMTRIAFLVLCVVSITGDRVRAQPERAAAPPGRAVAVTGRTYAVDFKEEIDKLKRRLKKDRKQEEAASQTDTSTQSAVCRPNDDLVAEVTSEPCDAYQASPNFRIWVRNKGRPAGGVVDVVSRMRDGKEQRNDIAAVLAPGRRWIGVCGIRASVKSCEFH